MASDPRRGVSPRPGRTTFRCLLEALPSWREILAGSLIWALVAGLSAVVGLLGEGWQTPAKLRSVALLFFCGGLLAFAPALWTARLLSRTDRPEASFAAFFLALALVTITVTAALFGLQYRFYYAEWHAELFSRVWLIQFVHTVAGAVFQFAVLGVRLYFPLGFVALFLAGFWFQRSAR